MQGITVFSFFHSPFWMPFQLMRSIIENLTRQNENQRQKKRCPQSHLVEAPPQRPHKNAKGGTKHKCTGAFPSARLLCKKSGGFLQERLPKSQNDLSVIVIFSISSLKYSLLVQLYVNVTSMRWNFKRDMEVSAAFCRIFTKCSTHDISIGCRYIDTERPYAGILAPFSSN